MVLVGWCWADMCSRQADGSYKKCNLRCFAAFQCCTAVLKSNTLVAGPRLIFICILFNGLRSWTVAPQWLTSHLTTQRSSQGIYTWHCRSPATEWSGTPSCCSSCLRQLVMHIWLCVTSTLCQQSYNNHQWLNLFQTGQSHLQHQNWLADT